MVAFLRGAPSFSNAIPCDPLLRHSGSSRPLLLGSRTSRFSNGELRFIPNPSFPLLRFIRDSPKQRQWVVRAKVRDYYETLNLDRNATLQEIKSSYRNLARKVSSQRNPFEIQTNLYLFVVIMFGLLVFGMFYSKLSEIWNAKMLLIYWLNIGIWN